MIPIAPAGTPAVYCLNFSLFLLVSCSKIGNCVPWGYPVPTFRFASAQMVWSSADLRQ